METEDRTYGGFMRSYRATALSVVVLVLLGVLVVIPRAVQAQASPPPRPPGADIDVLFDAVHPGNDFGGIFERGGESVDLSFAFPGGLGPTGAVVNGAGNVTLEPGAAVLDVAREPGVVGNAGEGAVNVGDGVRLGEVTSVGDISLVGAAEVRNVVSGAEIHGAGGRVSGVVAERAALDGMERLDVEVSFPRSTEGDRTIDGSRNLTPGSYGRVVVESGGTLRLSAGAYTFEELEVRSGATVLLPSSGGGGPTVLVHDRFRFAGRAGALDQRPLGVFLEPANWTVVVAGGDLVEIESSFTGALAAPAAPVLFASGSHAGWFYGAQVQVDAGVTVRARGGAAVCLPTRDCFEVPFEPVSARIPLPEAVPPTAPAEAGAVPWQFDVGASGQASYTVPIEVPPGPGGIQPELSLGYRSGKSNGPVGAGWSVGGLGAITRCPRTTGTDEAAAPIADDASDRFCLDGVPLYEVGDGDTYRTEIDGMDMIVPSASATGNPDYWTVMSKTGVWRLYGEAGATDGHDGVNRQWLLRRVWDLSGNQMTVHYRRSCEGCSDGALIPDRIDYGEHVPPDTLPADRSVVFEWEQRHDVLRQYERGQLRTQSLRLTAVRTTAGGQDQRDYRLDYDNGRRPRRADGRGGVSQVGSIQLCSLGACVPPTRFSYEQDRGLSQAVSTSNVTPTEQFGNGAPTQAFYQGATLVVDVNGDGFDDLLYPDNTVDRRPGDFDTGIRYHVARSTGLQGDATGARFHQPVATDLPADDFWQLPGGDLFHCLVQGNVIDIDGDGDDDIIDACHRRILVSDGETYEMRRGDLDFVPEGFFGRRQHVADLTGDGRADLLVCQPDEREAGLFYELYEGKGPGGGFVEQPRTFGGYGPGCEYTPMFLDTDGDGVVNAVQRESDPVRDVARGLVPKNDVPWQSLDLASGEWTDIGLAIWEPPSLEMLAGHEPPEPFNVEEDYVIYFPSSGTPSAITYSEGHQRKPADINSDGLMDLLVFDHRKEGGDRIQVRVNTGDGFVDGGPAISNPSVLPYVSTFSFRRAQVLDHDGDGRTDILLPTGISWKGDDLRWFLLENEGGQYRATEMVGYSLFDGSVPVVGDFDNEGGADLAMLDTGGDSSVKIAYGQARRTGLLTSAIDGVGKGIRVSHSVSGIHETSGKRVFSRMRCEAETRQQVQCLRKADSMVSWYEEGVLRPDPDHASPQFRPERTVTFSYTGAFNGMYQRGFLGFKVIDREVYDSAARRVSYDTRSFNPEILRAAVDGTPVRRIYPFAYRIGAQTEGYPSEKRRSDTLPVKWEVRVSESGMPFIHLASMTTKDVETRNFIWLPLRLLAPLRERELTVVERTFDVDAFGNETLAQAVQRNASGDEIARVKTERDFSPTLREQSSWLVGLVKEETTTSSTAEDEVTTTTELEYERGLVKKTISEPGDPGLALITSFARHPRTGHIESTTTTANDGETRTERTGYDDRGMFPTDHVDAKGHGARVVYGPDGSLLVAADPNGVAARYGYDGFGREVLVEGPSGATRTSYERGSADLGLRATRSSEGGEHVETLTDPNGRVVERTSSGIRGARVVESFAYDWAGRLVRRYRPHLPGDASQGEEAFEYDNLGRLTFRLAANGLQVKLNYSRPADADRSDWSERTRRDALEVQTVSDPYGTTSTVTGANGLPVATVDRAGEITQFRHDPLGHLATTWDPNGVETNVDHDRFGRLVSRDDPDSGTTRWSHSAFGDPISVVHPTGEVQRSSHDELGRPVLTVDGDGTVNRHHYDSASNGIGELRRSVRVGESAQDFSYEPHVLHGNRNLLASVTQQVGRSAHRVDFSYDAYGRPDTTTYPEVAGGRLAIRNAYDDNGNVVGVVDAASGVEHWRLDAADQGYRLGEARYGNGVVNRRTYAPTLGRLQSNSLERGDETLSSTSYKYRSDGRMSFRLDDLEARNNRSYTYDELGRLRTENRARASIVPWFWYHDELSSTTYDATGNITSHGGIGEYRYDAARPHAVVAAGDNEYGYDDAGRMTYRAGPDVVGGQQALRYNDYGLPAAVAIGADPDAAASITYAYDTFGKRVKQEAPAQTTVYVGDLFQEERAANGSVSYRHRVYAGSVEVAQVVRSGEETETLYLHDDELGSVEVITNGSGEVVHQQRFRPFGVPEGNEQGGTTGVRRGFTGHEQDEETGLVNMGARLYDGAIGRFLTPDPIVQFPYASQGLNPYTYAGNSPLDWTDPTGMTAESSGGGCTPTVAAQPGSEGDWGSVLTVEPCGGGGGGGETEAELSPRARLAGSKQEAAEVQVGGGGGTETVVDSAPIADSADPIASFGEGVLQGALTGVTLGAGIELLGAAAAAVGCPLCAGAVVAAGVGYVGYGLIFDGGAAAISDSASRLMSGKATTEDLMGLGQLVGGLVGGVAAIRSAGALRSAPRSAAPTQAVTGGSGIDVPVGALRRWKVTAGTTSRGVTPEIRAEVRRWAAKYGTMDGPATTGPVHAGHQWGGSHVFTAPGQTTRVGAQTARGNLRDASAERRAAAARRAYNAANPDGPQLYVRPKGGR